MEPTYCPGDILKETRQAISTALGEDLEILTAERTVMGLFFSGVKLNSGEGGLCFTPIKSIPAGGQYTGRYQSNRCRPGAQCDCRGGFRVSLFWKRGGKGGDIASPGSQSGIRGTKIPREGP